MTVRIVPLRSGQAGDARVGGTIEERIRLVRELSLRSWALSGLPVPSYDRKTMPVVMTTLPEQ